MKAMADGALRLGQRPQPPPGTQVPLVLASALHAAVGGSLSEAARTGQLLVPHPQLSPPPRMNTGPQATGELLPPRRARAAGVHTPSRLWAFALAVPLPRMLFPPDRHGGLLAADRAQSHVALGRPSRTTLSGRPHLLSVVMAG